MAIIYTYPIKTAADAGDLVLISDSKDGNKTKNTSISSIKDVIDVVDSISAGPGISVSNPTGNVTVGNTGVLSLIAGSNISLSGSTGNITISTSASNVDGSGTAGRVPKWTDSNTLGDSQISQNGSSVGIGTTLGTATGSLEVYNGSLNNQLFITCPDTSQAAINFGGISAKTKGKINYSDNSDMMMFHTNSSEKMRITSVGNVGIGTTGPGAKLQVNGTSGTTQAIIGYGTQNLYVGVDGTNVDLKSSGSTTGTFSFSTGNLERVRITSGGKVGIGTASPDSTLTVKAGSAGIPVVKAGVSGYANGITLIGDNYTTGTSQFNLGISYSGANGVLSRGVKVSNTTDDVFLSSQDIYATRPNAFVLDRDGSFRFFNTATNASTPVGNPVSLNERMRITSAGNVGIGTTSPTEKLSVNGTVDLTNLRVSGAQGNAGDVLTSNGVSGVSWAPVGGDNFDHWFAGCASVGSSSSSATNPRQASFTFPNEVGSSNFGPCIITGADFNVINVSIKWNGSNAPTIGANGTVDFKLGRLTNGTLNPDTQEGTVNYTNFANLTFLQITSADSGTWIYKFHNFAGSGPTFNAGQIMVVLFPRPTVGWTGTGATNGDLQMTMQVKYI